MIKSLVMAAALASCGYPSGFIEEIRHLGHIEGPWYLYYGYED